MKTTSKAYPLMALLVICLANSATGAQESIESMSDILQSVHQADEANPDGGVRKLRTVSDPGAQARHAPRTITPTATAATPQVLNAVVPPTESQPLSKANSKAKPAKPVQSSPVARPVTSSGSRFNNYGRQR